MSHGVAQQGEFVAALGVAIESFIANRSAALPAAGRCRGAHRFCVAMTKTSAKSVPGIAIRPGVVHRLSKR